MESCKYQKNKWLWEDTHVLKVVGSNPSTIYWMDIFSHLFVVEIVLLFEKMKINEKEAGHGPFLRYLERQCDCRS